MEPPVVPMSPRRRLIRDYSSEDAVPTVRTKNVGDGRPRGFDVDAPAARTGSWLDSDNNDGRTTSFRIRNEEHHDFSRRANEAESYQQVTIDQRNQQEQEDLRKLDFNLDPIDENQDTPTEQNSDYARSVSSLSRTSETTGVTSTSGSRLPDFFSSDTFQVVLHNPTTAHQFLKFSQSRLCGENLEFLEKVDRYHTLLNEVAKILFEIHKDYISPSASTQISIPPAMLAKVNKDLKTSLSGTLPKLESVFVDAQSDVERLVSMDIYPRFVRHQMTLSATRALASNKDKYAGLGDCFVLTDPSRADNPIVFASDGFVKVTGYSRNEIIPRNCRFLQNKQTDKSAVKRLKQAIEKREESVELLLNETKTGEPFWNLLYTTPLFDAKGNVVFFLGGQINCSTTIHSASDILRILALKADVDEQPTINGLAPVNGADVRGSRSSRLFSAFRSKPAVQPRAVPGMENQVVEKIEKLNLKKQMDVFYTAYSKFIIINASSHFISFHSSGITDLLYPARIASTYNTYNSTTSPSPHHSSPSVTTPFTTTQLVGQDIFKFLANHSNNNLPSGFKSKVKNAIKEGKAISLELMLCTRRFMGFERFAVHWTPLKGEEGVVGWVVLTLGGAGDA